MRLSTIKIASIPSLLGLVVAVLASSAQADLITTVTIADFSSENVAGADRDADYLVDGSGLTGTGIAGSTHNEDLEGEYWSSAGSLGGVAPGGGASGTDFDPFVTFDLGGSFNVDTIRLWNGNRSGFTVFGADDIEIFAGNTLGTLTSQGSIAPAIGTGLDTYVGEDFAVSFTAQFIQFDIKGNHDGAIFDGTNAVPGADGRSLADLAEVRFEGTAVPEPSSLLLMGIGLAGLGLRRRRS